MCDNLPALHAEMLHLAEDTFMLGLSAIGQRLLACAEQVRQLTVLSDASPAAAKEHP